MFSGNFGNFPTASGCFAGNLCRFSVISGHSQPLSDHLRSFPAISHPSRFAAISNRFPTIFSNFSVIFRPYPLVYRTYSVISSHFSVIYGRLLPIRSFSAAFTDHFWPFVVISRSFSDHSFPFISSHFPIHEFTIFCMN